MPEPGSKMFWLSFCDGDRPKGDQFLGVCIVEVSADEAADAMVEVFLRFPMAQDGAEWLAAAVKKTHRLRINPGGEVASCEVDPERVQFAGYPMDTLMNRAFVENIEMAHLARMVDPPATGGTPEAV